MVAPCQGWGHPQRRPRSGATAVTLPGGGRYSNTRNTNTWTRSRMRMRGIPQVKNRPVSRWPPRGRQRVERRDEGDVDDGGQTSVTRKRERERWHEAAHRRCAVPRQHNGAVPPYARTRDEKDEYCEGFPDPGTRKTAETAESRQDSGHRERNGVQKVSTRVFCVEGVPNEDVMACSPADPAQVLHLVADIGTVSTRPDVVRPSYLEAREHQKTHDGENGEHDQGPTSEPVPRQQMRGAEAQVPVPLPLQYGGHAPRRSRMSVSPAMRRLRR